MTRTPKAILLAAGLLAFAGGSAWAEKGVTVTAPSPFTERVPYAPADLASDAGIRDLRQRVRSAAHRVCVPADAWFMATYYDEARCYDPTVRDALAQVDRAVERQRSGAGLAMNAVTVRAR